MSENRLAEWDVDYAPEASQTAQKLPNSAHSSTSERALAHSTGKRDSGLRKSASQASMALESVQEEPQGPEAVNEDAAPTPTSEIAPSPNNRLSSYQVLPPVAASGPETTSENDTVSPAAVEQAMDRKVVEGRPRDNRLAPGAGVPTQPQLQLQSPSEVSTEGTATAESPPSTATAVIATVAIPAQATGTNPDTAAPHPPVAQSAAAPVVSPAAVPSRGAPSGTKPGSTKSTALKLLRELASTAAAAVIAVGKRPSAFFPTLTAHIEFRWNNARVR